MATVVSISDPTRWLDGAESLCGKSGNHIMSVQNRFSNGEIKTSNMTAILKFFLFFRFVFKSLVRSS